MSNHGHVLVALDRDPASRLRDIAAEVGITERAVQQIIGQLVEEGFLEKGKIGRRNVYRIVPGKRFRHPLEQGVRVRAFLDLVQRAQS